MDEWKRSGQIPAFGNWDLANELPITQYFECARQAGLVSYSSSSGESDPYNVPADHDLYAVDFNRRPSTLKKGTRNRERRCPHVMVKDKEHMRKQGNGNVNVWDVTEQARKPISKSKSKQLHQHDAVPQSPPPRRVGVGGSRSRPPKPKPVDEDLYKIPPELLLRTTKRKKMLGFISKCLVPTACVS